MRAIPRANAAGRRIALGLLFAAIAFAIWPAQAGDVEDLYEAQVPVATQGEAERGRALVTAFEAVLVKVTGRRDAAAAPEIRAALRQPMAYVQQYLYRPLPAAPPDADPQAPPYTQLMRVRFDAQAINRLVQRAGVPLWGRVRPTTLMWVAVEDGGERYLLGADGHEDLRALLEGEAQRRGLPVLLPLLDLEDRRALFFTDVWGNFGDAVLKASARYQVAAVAVGRLLREPDGRWSARWSLYHEGAAEHWSVPGADRAQAVAGGVDGAADTLGARYARAVSPDGGQFADLAVTGVTGLADYGRTMAYLRGLDQVRELQVLGVEGDSVLFRVRIGGDAEGLTRTIAFGTTLAPAPAMPARTDGADVPALSYRLLP